jgi:hypothetical protein
MTLPQVLLMRSSSLLRVYFAFRDEFSLDDQLVANVHDVEFDLVLHSHLLLALAFPCALDDHHFEVPEFVSLIGYRISLNRGLYDEVNLDPASSLRNHDVDALHDYCDYCDYCEVVCDHLYHFDEVRDLQISFRFVSFKRCAWSFFTIIANKIFTITTWTITLLTTWTIITEAALFATRF